MFVRVVLVACLTALLRVNIQAQCANPIACENALLGNPASEWDITETGDPTIQGFATDISVNRGQTITFKIKSTAAAYRLDIYRLGYYGGLGARKVATVNPSVTLPQTQPQCISDSTTGLFDCGNWANSASWAVPSSATSGVYIARLVRSDTGGASHIVFIVRDDAGRSDLLFQTSDLTWQAYNDYGGCNLYPFPGDTGPGPGGSAYKVSYNRPFNTRTLSKFCVSYLFGSEYPMIRWLEANGYNVSYASGIDTDRRGSAALKTHKVFLSVGHDEYWSGGQRASVEGARDAGVHLAYFSADEMFWKTRWENSIAGPATSYRTLVCYKETNVAAKIDPTPTWTGTWRDPRFSPPSDGGRPENAVNGQFFQVDSFRHDPLFIPASQGKLRFWRNTGVDTLAVGQVAQLPAGVLGYEWDEAAENGFQPGGLIRMSTTTLPVDTYVSDYGKTDGPGIATHSLTLYRHSSGALVFGAGTTQWSWGLDAVHDIHTNITSGAWGPITPVDPRMKQATVNLLADMGVQPVTLQPALVPATASTNTITPKSIISGPVVGASISTCQPIVISGTASTNGGDPLAGVEYSVDGGTTWYKTNGTTSWSAQWTPTTPGVVTVKSRAINDSGWSESPGSGVVLTVVASTCPSDTNVALTSAGGVASASSIYDLNYPPAAMIDNERAGVNAGHGGMWADSTMDTYPDWAQVNFSGMKTINRVVVYTLQDNYQNAGEPSDTTTFSVYGIVDFNVQVWDGSSWITVGTVTGNNLVKRTVTFAQFTTDRIRINVTKALSTFSRIVEIQAWVPADKNLALASVGGVASASSVYGVDYPPAAINDGDRTGVNAGRGGMWADATASSYPDWAQVNFNGMKTINRVVVFTLQDNYSIATEPYDTMPFSVYGVVDFTVQGWDGLSWVTLGTVTKNNLVKRTVAFPPFTTDRIRVNITSALATFSRIVELEAWGFDLEAGAPIFTPAPGTFSSSQAVTLVSLTPGSQIFYTTDGTSPTTSSNRYSVPIVVTSSTVIKAFTTASGLRNSPIVTANYAIQAQQTSPPAFSPAGGTFSVGQSVTLSTTTTGANIFYTTNGSIPTSSSTLYSAPISVSNNTTIKAIAVAGLSTSSISSAAYAFQAFPPTFTPPGGNYASAQSVKLSDGSPGAQIYYTVDGSTPTTSSTLYTGTNIAVNASMSFNAIAAVSGWTNSSVSSAAYTINQQSGGTPALPGNLVATAVSATQINLTWLDNSSNETAFKIERKTGAAGTYAQIAAPAAGTTSYNDTTVAGATTYYYRMRSTNAFGDSGYSNEANATTPASGTLPAPWIDVDVGSTGIAGSATYANGSFTINGAGADIWGTADAFNYVYQPMTGDAEIVAKVNSVQNTDVWAKAGVMIRETLTAGSEQALMAITSASGAAFQRRVSTAGASTHTAGASVTAPYWVRLTRKGNVFTGYTSTDGLNWTQVGTDTISMVPGVYIGVAVTSHTTAALNQSVISNVFVTTQPASPSGLTATAVSSSQVNLGWVDNSTNESGFKIERKTGAGGTYAQIATLAAGVTSYSDSGLTTNTSYYYRVRSSNTAGDSAYSNEANVTTPSAGTVPAAPASLNAAAISSSQITLNWADVSSETGFKIERKTGAGGTYTQIGTTGTNVTTYSDTNLAAATTFFYRVRATNATGDSPYSPEASANTSGIAPTAPTSLTATPTSSSQINLAWADVVSETGFKIERKTGAGGTYAQIATVGAAIVTYSDPGLTPSTTYFYRVRATNAVGDSPYSPEASATTLGPPPAAPASLTATAASSSQINLSWPDVANETGFKIERKLGAGGTYAQIAATGANVTSYNNTGLSSSTTYFYRVRATNAGGDSSYSPEASATTSSSPPAFRSASSAGAASGTLTINKPAGTQTGDVMVTTIAVRPGTATITASGWTLIRRMDNSSGNSNSLAVYYKVAGSSEPTSYSFSFSTSTGAAGGIASFIGIDTANPVDTDAGQNTSSSLTHAAPSVTTRYANDMVVTSHAFASSATFIPPSGMTEAFDVASISIGSTGESIEGNYQLQSAIGATGTRTATASNDADTGNAHTLALKSK